MPHLSLSMTGHDDAHPRRPLTRQVAHTLPKFALTPHRFFSFDDALFSFASLVHLRPFHTHASVRLRPRRRRRGPLCRPSLTLHPPLFQPFSATTTAITLPLILTLPPWLRTNPASVVAEPLIISFAYPSIKVPPSLPGHPSTSRLGSLTPKIRVYLPERHFFVVCRSPMPNAFAIPTDASRACPLTPKNSS
jgi:hypothetical protein